MCIFILVTQSRHQVPAQVRWAARAGFCCSSLETLYVYYQKTQPRSHGGLSRRDFSKILHSVTTQLQLLLISVAGWMSRVRPKNSAETRWSIEPQGLLKDSPLCDDATPIPPDLCRRLDESTPTGGHRIPSGRESHSPGTTRWQTPALHRRPAHPAGAQSQARRSAPPG